MAKGSSWGSESVCLGRTRAALREEILEWIRSADIGGAAEIMWLNDVAGSGKSTVAHTIAQQCHDEGLLVSCFFFDRMSPDRNGPQNLFSTIAYGLASNADVAEQIGLTIERNRSIINESPADQFKAFLLDIALEGWYPIDKPVVIILDGLDEDRNDSLLKILRNEVPKLPGNFRFLVTSRPQPTMLSFMSERAHIRSCTMDINGQANLEDIAAYVLFKLEEVAMRTDMGSDWPGEELSRAFTRRAEGLFSWVKTVCDYLASFIDPTGRLISLVSNGSSMGGQNG